MKCQTCGHQIHGNFCATCGEKKFDKHELTLRHFFSEALESFLHFDNKFLRTLKVLILKPGKLAVEFAEGRRVNYMKPLQLFLVLNLIFFVTMTASNPFALQLQNYLNYTPFTNYGTQMMVDLHLEKHHMTLEEFQPEFNHKIATESKEFIFLYIVFYAIMFALLFVFYKRRITEHLTLATHFMSFYLIYSMANLFLITLPFYLLFAKTNYSQTFDNVSTLLSQIIVFVYLYLSFNTFYHRSKIWNFVAAGTVAASFFVFIQLYRMMLFVKIVKFE